jgi:DNA-binding HxlR family transcriptional regulator
MVSNSPIINPMAKDADLPDLTLCSRYHRAIELIGRRWTGAIVYLLLRSRCRFATLRAAIPEITDRMLSERRQELEPEGIVDRTVHAETPVRVEYTLTRKGRALAAAVEAMAAWAERWVEVEDAAHDAARRASKASRRHA